MGIKYKQGYKYQLAENYTIATDIFPPELITDDGFITLQPDGTLTIHKGYAWDGPSGPTIDGPSFMRGSLVHDALYQLMRGGYLDPEKYRELADLLLFELCVEDGMPKVAAWIVFKGVRLAGELFAAPSFKKPILNAP